MISWAHQRRRNGELLPCTVSSFLRGLPDEHFEKRATIRLRGSARLASPFPSSFSSSGSGRFTSEERYRQPKLPAWSPRAGERVTSFIQDEDTSQDAPSFVPGERVRHAQFGSGAIAEVSGSGKDAKVTVDFDDEAIGRKRLVIAFAGLTRAFD
jgi:DNA helicase-2/ATP-dependent DNA helicase PcrA